MPITDIAFAEVLDATHYEFLPAALVFFDETFDADTGQFTKLSELSAPATFSLTGGQAVLDNSTSGQKNDIIQEGTDLALPQAAVQIDVVSQANSGGTPTSFDNIGVGICKDANNFVFASVDRINHFVRVQVKVGGTNTFNANVTKTLTAPYKLGLSVVGNSACVWADTGSGWVYQTGYDFSSKINLKTADLTGWKAAFTVATHNNSKWTFDNFKAGRFGTVAVRDITLVTNDDGTAYLPGDGTVLLTASCADALGGPGGSYQGFFSLDLSTYALTQTGVLFVDRGSAKQNDSAGHLVRRSDGTFLFTIATWANGLGNAIDIWHGSSADALLSGSWLVSGMAKLTIPGQSTGYAAYDPFLALDGSTWYLAYSLTSDSAFVTKVFYPALATSADRSAWTSAGSASSDAQHEGTKLARIPGGVLNVTAGGPTDVRVYDTSMTYLGNLDAVVDGDGNIQPHGMVFWTGSKWLLTTFDGQHPAGITGVWTWGHLHVHEGVWGVPVSHATATDAGQSQVLGAAMSLTTATDAGHVPVLNFPWLLGTTCGAAGGEVVNEDLEFETTLDLLAAAGGSLDAPAGGGDFAFETATLAGQQYLASDPTLVAFATVTAAAEALSLAVPLDLATLTGARAGVTIYTDGRRDLLSGRRYRR